MGRAIWAPAPQEEFCDCGAFKFVAHASRDAIKSRLYKDFITVMLPDMILFKRVNF